MNGEENVGGKKQEMKGHIFINISMLLFHSLLVRDIQTDK